VNSRLLPGALAASKSSGTIPTGAVPLPGHRCHRPRGADCLTQLRVATRYANCEGVY